MRVTAEGLLRVRVTAGLGAVGGVGTLAEAEAVEVALQADAGGGGLATSRAARCEKRQTSAAGPKRLEGASAPS
jgi:hypothetical protein